jgi:hypothetical protein
MKLLLWLIYIIPSIGLSQSIQFRHYKKGEYFQCLLTTESLRDNQPDSKTIHFSSQPRARFGTFG